MAKKIISESMLRAIISEEVVKFKKRLTLEAEKKEYDVFFDEFLEVFSDKMSEHDKTSPVWEAYKKRYSQWQDIATNIKNVNYYMGML
jgi:hypothetical protein